MKKVSPELQQQIADRLLAGQYPPQVRRETGAQFWQIYRVRKSLDLPPLGRQYPTDYARQQQQEALALREQGFTLNQIGARLTPPVTGKRVHQILKGTALQKLHCSKCGKESHILFFFPPHCTVDGAKALCPECSVNLNKP